MLRLFRLHRLEVAALGAEIGFTAAKFGEDVFQDASQAIPGVLWFFGVFSDSVGILHTTLWLPSPMLA